MKNLVGVSDKMIYNNRVGSRHMDVLRLQSGDRWAVGSMPWIGSLASFSQETGAGCRLVVKDWLEAHFATESTGRA